MWCPTCSTPIPEENRRCPACGADPVTSAPTEPVKPSGSLEMLNLPPGASFAGRYTIIERAGEGGMGVVYKAIDRTLDQVVALKLIRPDLARVPGYVERFKQEVRLTRQVSHPNVCRVHDLGAVDDVFFLSMEWIEGETLRRFLNQAVLLEPRRALGIAARILDALNAAHERGIIHRDLKPENVMIDARGSVHVMDFGVAQGPGEGRRPGAHPGTPLYMSPEQRRGEPLDYRTDLYSLGLIIQEMLIGQAGPPGKPGPLPLPQHLRAAVGPLLAGLLAEKPEERTVSPEAMEAALRELGTGSGRAGRIARFLRLADRHRRALLAAGALVVAAAIAAPFLFRREGSAPPAIPAESASQAPPEPVASSPASIYCQRGLYYLREDGDTQRILNQGIQMLNRAVEKDPASALAWAALGEAYWTRYERTLEPSSREEALRAVEKASALAPDLAEVRNARGRGLIAEGDYAAAIPELKRAVEMRPDFDTAWANLGIAYREIKDGYQPGLDALHRAIRLKPGSFRHQVYLGLFHYRFGEYDPAEKAYRRALELRPDSVTAWENLATIFLQRNRPDETISALTEALKIEEIPYTHSNLGTAYFFRGDYRQAADHYRRATEMEPKNPDLWGNLGDALKMMKQNSEARAAYLRAAGAAREKLALSPRDPGAHMTLGLYCARAGDAACALEEGGRAEVMQPENLDVLFKNAVILSILGRTDAAFDRLEKAAKLGLTRVVIENDPDLLPLRDHPRYRRILELAN